MSTRYVLKTLLPLIAALAPAVSDAACTAVTGTVKLMPDAACSVQSYVKGTVFSGECYTVKLDLQDFPAATGFAGTTTEALIGANGVPTLSPAVILMDANPTLPRQIVQTARTAIMIGQGARRSTLYTTDVVVIQTTISATGQITPGVVTEQILIAGTDGKGAYAAASGYLTVLGNSIGRNAPVSGNICLSGDARRD